MTTEGPKWERGMSLRELEATPVGLRGHHLARTMLAPSVEALYRVRTGPDTRRTLAQNKHLTEATLEVLSVDADKMVRIRIALHASLPCSLVQRLSADESPSVRANVASRRGLPKSLQTLSRDSSTLVLESLQENPDVVWSAALGARFVYTFRPEVFADLTRGMEADFVAALASSSDLSVQDLVEAHDLVTR